MNDCFVYCFLFQISLTKNKISNQSRCMEIMSQKCKPQWHAKVSISLKNTSKNAEWTFRTTQADDLTISQTILMSRNGQSEKCSNALYLSFSFNTKYYSNLIPYYCNFYRSTDSVKHSYVQTKSRGGKYQFNLGLILHYGSHVIISDDFQSNKPLEYVLFMFCHTDKVAGIRVINQSWKTIMATSIV